MPTTFRELFKVALELNSINVAASSADAEEGASLSRQTSDGSLEPTLTPCDSLTFLASSSCSMSMDYEGSATAAAAATAAAPLPSALQESGSFSSVLGGEADALMEGERGSSLGSTSVEEGVPDRSVLRAGSSMEAPGAVAATGCSRVFAVIQQFEDANSRTRGSKHRPSSPPRRRASSTATATASSPQRRAASQSKQTNEKKAQQQQQAKEPRPAMASPGRSTRRSSGGNGNSDVASPGVASRASLYMLAQARDGINEMHPEVLERRIQVSR